MSRLFDAMTTKDLKTENGMPTHSTSGSFVVDFFYKMGGQRAGREPLGKLVGLFYAAFGENSNLAIKALLNLRDPRGGMGERETGRILWNSLANSHPELVKKLIPYIPVFGRWDDLFYLLDSPCETEMAGFYFQALMSGDKLAGKWAVRENKRGPKHFQKGAIARRMKKHWDLSAHQYRDLLSSKTEVIETLMCDNQWEKINFEHVPSQAHKKYREAFKTHQEERYAEYLSLVEKGEKKINATVITPVEIVHQYLTKGPINDKTLELLWENLPDVVPADLSFLPVCDLSGSMFMSGGLPAEVSLALGIFLAKRNKSIFQNGFITFSRVPKLITLTGNNLRDNVAQARAAGNFAENTNLQATFELILNSAVRAKLPPEDMPTHILIVSDMQFDQCTDVNGTRAGYGRTAWKDSVLEMIDLQYQEAGYTRPNIVFWNVANASGVPVKVTDSGVALVSGFSVNLMKNILKGEMSPLAQVLAILNSGRYDFVNEIVN